MPGALAKAQVHEESAGCLVEVRCDQDARIVKVQSRAGAERSIGASCGRPGGVEDVDRKANDEHEREARRG